MKILQISNKNPVPARDGGSIATFRLSCGLVNQGHDVVIMAMNTSKHFIDEDLWSPIAKQIGFKLHPVPVNTSIRPLSALKNLFFSKLPYTATRFYNKDFKKQLEEILRQESFDYIIIENLYPFLYLNSIKKFSKAKIVMRAHNVEHEIWQRTASNTKGLKGWYFRKLAKRIKLFEIKYLNQYDFLLPITQRDLLEFNNLGNTKPAMALPTGISLDKNCCKINIERIHEIAHLGALDWAPNQEGIVWFLEKVWPLVKSANPEAIFHIAGRNAPLWLEKKIAHHNAQYHGEVDSANDFICQFPIHVVPLWSGSGMRIKIIEAMSQARVIITTPIGVEGIPAINNEALIINETERDFANSIIELINNQDKLCRISQNAFTFVEDHFENSKLVGSFIRFLKEHDVSR